MNFDPYGKEYIFAIKKKELFSKKVGVNVLAESVGCISTVQVEDCSRDCKVGLWGSWNPCTKEEDSKRTRYRNIIHTPLNGGTPCCDITMFEHDTNCVLIREAKHFPECGKQ